MSASENWPHVLSVQQLADELDCTPQTISDRCHAGELPAIKYGRSWKLPAAALLAHLNAEAAANVRRPPSARAKPLAPAPVVIQAAGPAAPDKRRRAPLRVPELPSPASMQ